MTRLSWAAVVAWSVLAAACFAALDPWLEALVGAAGCAVVVAVTVTDLERRTIPNRIVLPALGAALVVQTVRDPSIEWIVSAVVAGAFFLVLALIHPAGLGMGDVKLAAFLGAWLGRNVVVALFAGSLLSLAPALGVLLLRGAAGRKVGLPFAPFLAAGALVALFWGDALVDWWIG